MADGALKRKRSVPARFLQDTDFCEAPSLGPRKLSKRSQSTGSQSCTEDEGDLILEEIALLEPAPESSTSLLGVRQQSFDSLLDDPLFAPVSIQEDAQQNDTRRASERTLTRKKSGGSSDVDHSFETVVEAALSDDEEDAGKTSVLSTKKPSVGKPSTSSFSSSLSDGGHALSTNPKPPKFERQDTELVPEASLFPQSDGPELFKVSRTTSSSSQSSVGPPPPANKPLKSQSSGGRLGLFRKGAPKLADINKKILENIQAEDAAGKEKKSEGSEQKGKILHSFSNPFVVGSDEESELEDEAQTDLEFARELLGKNFSFLFAPSFEACNALSKKKISTTLTPNTLTTRPSITESTPLPAFTNVPKKPSFLEELDSVSSAKSTAARKLSKTAKKREEKIRGLLQAVEDTDIIPLIEPPPQKPLPPPRAKRELNYTLNYLDNKMSFKIYEDDPFSILQTMFLRDQELIGQFGNEWVQISYNGQPIDCSKTSIALSYLPPSAILEVNLEDPNATPYVAEDLVLIKLQSASAAKKLKTAKDKPLKHVFEKYCEEMGRPLQEFDFLFDGDRLTGEETASSLDVDDEMTIDVRAKK